MPRSILKQVLFAFLGFGIVVASIFPLYADFFVEWKPGMLSWFVVGCFLAGIFIGVANYYVMKVVLVSKLKRISQVAGAIANKDLSFTCSMVSHDTIGDIIISFNHMAATLRELLGQASSLSSQVRTDSEGIQGQTDQIRGRVHQLADAREAIGPNKERAGKDRIDKNDPRSSCTDILAILVGKGATIDPHGPVWLWRIVTLMGEEGLQRFPQGRRAQPLRQTRQLIQRFVADFPTVSLANWG